VPTSWIPTTWSCGPKRLRPGSGRGPPEALPGDPCPECGTSIQLMRGIEVGHVFQLGSVYSAKMDACYTDADGVRKPLIMGCYGIGVDRTLAAIIEQNHDDRE